MTGGLGGERDAGPTDRLTCSLLMIVTPPEVPIAEFTIKALQKCNEIPNLFIVVFANGLDESDQNKIRTWTEGLRDAVVVSNREKIEREKHNFRIGEEYTTALGRRELRVGPYESAPEIWERELQRLDTDIVGIMDPDFEILDAKFLPEMIDAFSADDRLAFMSVDHSPETRTFESYSQTWATIAERYHTWFCLYLREALRNEANFSYFEERRGEEIVKFDHSGRLQEVLRKDYNYHGAVLDRTWRWAFVHYYAFAQNRTLNGGLLRIYRYLRIGAATGWLSAHRVNFLVPPVKLISRIMYKALSLGRFDRERARYRFDEEH
jgi:hypothetical protein